MKKILIIGANYNSFNKGVGALSLSVIDIIKKKYPKAKITILDLHYNNQKNSDKTINFIILNKTKLILFFIFSNFTFLNFSPNKFSKLQKQDLILDIGEGDSFSDIYEFKRIIAFSILKIIFYNLNKKIIMLPQTIGPFNSLIGKFFAKASLNKVTTIYVRENISYKLAKELTKNPNKIKLSSDLAFTLKPKIVPNFKYKNFIGINVSGLLYNRSQRQKLLGKNFNYPKLISKIVEYFLTIKKTVILIPHTYSIKGKAGFDDLKACQDIRSKIKNKNLRIISNSHTAKELKYIIGKSEYFIGSRMHSCIAAISQLVPTTPISYSYKFEGVFKKLDLEKTIGNPKTMTENNIFNLVIQNYNNKKIIFKNLKPKILEAQNEVKKIFQSI